MNNLGYSQEAKCNVIRGRQMQEDLEQKGVFLFEHFRNGKLIHSEELKNGVTNEGKDASLDIMFGADSKIATWYAGIIDQSGYSAVAAADTMASHAGWTEFTTYTESVRQTWGAGTAASQSITNATAMTFNITGTGTLKGVFVASDSTKSGTSGTLWATALFASDTAVINGDQLKVTYTVNAS